MSKVRVFGLQFASVNAQVNAIAVSNFKFIACGNHFN